MSMPGFTADVSLAKGGRFRDRSSDFPAAAVHVAPAMGCPPGQGASCQVYCDTLATCNENDDHSRQCKAALMQVRRCTRMGCLCLPQY